MNLKNMILDKEIIDTNRDIVKADLHITLGIDENFAMGMGVLITSILENNKENIGFHIFTDKLSSETKEKLSELARKYNNASIVIYNMDYEQLKRLPTYFIWTTAMYYRFLVPIELNKIGIKYCWYLDSDELCIGKIGDLVNVDRDNAFAAVFCETPVDDKQRLETLLGYSDFRMFYSAGLYINIENWCRLQISEKAIDGLINEGDKYRLPDADALLKATKYQWNEMDIKYNYVYNIVGDKGKTIPNDLVFIHFAGTAKPWKAWAQDNDATKIWLEYKENSPWKNYDIEMPKTYKQAKFMLRYMKRVGCYIGYWKWAFLYAWWKLLKRK